MVTHNPNFLTPTYCSISILTTLTEMTLFLARASACNIPNTLLQLFCYWAISSGLRSYSYISLISDSAQVTMYCQGLNVGLLHAKQVPNLLNYPLSPELVLTHLHSDLL